MKFLLFAGIPITSLLFSCKKDQNQSPLPVVKGWTVTTIAGDGSHGSTDSAALLSNFNGPIDVVVANNGTIYIADFKHHCIRKIANGITSTIAGNNNYGFVNGQGTLAEFMNPYRISIYKRKTFRRRSRSLLANLH